MELSFPKNKIRILLLEGVHPSGVARLEEAGFSVTSTPKSMSPEELAAVLPDFHVLGVRSKTQIQADVLQNAKKLLAIGCFGVGTNQVDLHTATSIGVPVFNAPYGNTRSVAELAIGNIIMLARQAVDKNTKMHAGLWDKSAQGAKEIRGKVLGIIGFGHIGQQVGIMAEALGMRVIFYDSAKRLPIGNTIQVQKMDEVFAKADFISLHVPEMPKKEALIGRAEIQKLKQGCCLLNLSRGTLIDFTAVREAIQSGHLGGVAIDVYPTEPKSNSEPFQCELAGVSNVILTPHLGGSTEEAQENIALEVASAFLKFIDQGVTTGAVNFPQIDLPAFPESHRILHIHRNVPGVLREVNDFISEVGANIDGQYLGTYQDIGYVIIDLNKQLSEEVKSKITGLPSTIRTRILY